MKQINVKFLLTALLITSFGVTAGARNFGSDATIGSENNIVFDDFSKNGDITNFSSLYVRGTASTSNTSSSATLGGQSFSPTKMLKVNASSGESSITASLTAGGTASISNCLAVNLSVPGTLYTYYRISSTTNEEDYEMALYDNGTKVTLASGSTSTSGNTNKSLSYTTKSPSTIFITCTHQHYILAFRFVPSTEDYISATTFWNFAQFYNWNTGSAHTPVSVLASTGMLNYSGLYLHMNSTSGVIATSVQNSSQSVKDGEDVKRTLASPLTCLHFNKGGGTVGTETAGYDKNNDAIAFNASCPGTAYVLARGTAYDSGSNRYLRLYFDGTQVDEQLYTTADYYTLKYTSTQPGTFYFKGSTANWHVAAVLFVPTEEEDEAMIKTITIGSTGWATFSAPHIYKIPTGLSAYYVSSYSKEKGAVLSPISTTIPANTGVLLHGNPDDYPLKSTSTADEVDNKLVANIGAFVLPSTTTVRMNSETNIDNTNFILVKDGDTNNVKFAKVDGTSTLAGNKAFLRIPTADLPAGAREFNISFDNSTTGIANAHVNINANANENYYNLAGQRVAQPTKGLYIVNGKKYIVK